MSIANFQLWKQSMEMAVKVQSDSFLLCSLLIKMEVNFNPIFYLVSRLFDRIYGSRKFLFIGMGKRTYNFVVEERGQNFAHRAHKSKSIKVCKFFSSSHWLLCHIPSLNLWVFFSPLTNMQLLPRFICICIYEDASISFES